MKKKMKKNMKKKMKKKMIMKYNQKLKKNINSFIRRFQIEAYYSCYKCGQKFMSFSLKPHSIYILM